MYVPQQCWHCVTENLRLGFGVDSDLPCVTGDVHRTVRTHGVDYQMLGRVGLNVCIPCGIKRFGCIWRCTVVTVIGNGGFLGFIARYACFKGQSRGTQRYVRPLLRS